MKRIVPLLPWMAGEIFLTMSVAKAQEQKGVLDSVSYATSTGVGAALPLNQLMAAQFLVAKVSA